MCKSHLRNAANKLPVVPNTYPTKNVTGNFGLDPKYMYLMYVGCVYRVVRIKYHFRLVRCVLPLLMLLLRVSLIFMFMVLLVFCYMLKTC